MQPHFHHHLALTVVNFSHKRDSHKPPKEHRKDISSSHSFFHMQETFHAACTVANDCLHRLSCMLRLSGSFNHTADTTDLPPFTAEQDSIPHSAPSIPTGVAHAAPSRPPAGGAATLQVKRFSMEHMVLLPSHALTEPNAALSSACVFPTPIARTRSEAQCRVSLGEVLFSDEWELLKAFAIRLGFTFRYAALYCTNAHADLDDEAQYEHVLEWNHGDDISEYLDNGFVWYVHTNWQPPCHTRSLYFFTVALSTGSAYVYHGPSNAATGASANLYVSWEKDWGQFLQTVSLHCISPRDDAPHDQGPHAALVHPPMCPMMPLAASARSECVATATAFCSVQGTLGPGVAAHHQGRWIVRFRTATFLSARKDIRAKPQTTSLAVQCTYFNKLAWTYNGGQRWQQGQRLNDELLILSNTYVGLLNGSEIEQQRMMTCAVLRFVEHPHDALDALVEQLTRQIADGEVDDAATVATYASCWRAPTVCGGEFVLNATREPHERNAPPERDNISEERAHHRPTTQGDDFPLAPAATAGAVDCSGGTPATQDYNDCPLAPAAAEGSVNGSGFTAVASDPFMSMRAEDLATQEGPDCSPSSPCSTTMVGRVAQNSVVDEICIPSEVVDDATWTPQVNHCVASMPSKRQREGDCAFPLCEASAEGHQRSVHSADLWRGSVEEQLAKLRADVDALGNQVCNQLRMIAQIHQAPQGERCHPPSNRRQHDGTFAPPPHVDGATPWTKPTTTHTTSATGALDDSPMVPAVSRRAPQSHHLSMSSIHSPEDPSGTSSIASSSAYQQFIRPPTDASPTYRVRVGCLASPRPADPQTESPLLFDIPIQRTQARPDVLLAFPSPSLFAPQVPPLYAALRGSVASRRPRKHTHRLVEHPRWHY